MNKGRKEPKQKTEGFLIIVTDHLDEQKSKFKSQNRINKLSDLKLILLLYVLD